MKVEVWVRPFDVAMDEPDAMLLAAVRQFYPVYAIRLYGRSHRWLQTPRLFAPLEVFYASLINVTLPPDAQRLLETLWVVDFNSTQMLAVHWADLPRAPWDVSPSMQLHYFGGLVTLEVVVHLDYAKAINYAEN